VINGWKLDEYSAAGTRGRHIKMISFSAEAVVDVTVDMRHHWAPLK